MITHRLSVRDLKRKMDAGVALLIIDVRGGFCDSDRMIPGAIHIDAKDINPHLFNLGHDLEVVVYGNQDQDDATLKVADALQAAGFCAEALQGGWNAWLEAGFPTEARQSRNLPRSTSDLTPAMPSRQEQGQEEQGTESRGRMNETRDIVDEARERVQETAAGTSHALGDLASRALRLVQTLIRR